MTAVRVFYIVGLVVFSFGGVRALDCLETHQTSHLVSGIVIAAIGAGLLILAAVRHRRLQPGERRPIYGNAKQSGVIGLAVGAGLAVFGALTVWAMFTPDVGLKALPVALLFFAMAAWSFIDGRRKLRHVSGTDAQPTG
ncbi:MAG TPA: hypothetical protein VKI00_25470 [Mycobacterium sp.]|uniref:hypothetical protein n=1 Tax=Mycobacterium sp. TaxID=1785 RepID=UPI002C184F01|nr:hypothetical protein [Mycobacterium sp.]HME78879.1 hypothetical protein [Mycobacterium sp.]